MQLPVEYRDGWMKFPLAEGDGRATTRFEEGIRGRLYSLAPHLRPSAVDAIVWRADRDGVVFRFTGPVIAPPPLSTIPRERQFHLSGSWVWTWAAAST
jgi:hypothetical protein